MEGSAELLRTAGARGFHATLAVENGRADRANLRINVVIAEMHEARELSRKWPAWGSGPTNLRVCKSWRKTSTIETVRSTRYKMFAVVVRRAALARALTRALSASASEASGKHVPYGAVGSGFYSDNTKGCYDVVQRSRPLALAALADVLGARAKRGAPAKREPFTLVDYGTADAGTSMPLVKEIVSAVRAAEPESPVVVIYEDQSANDWNSVFARVHNRLPQAEPSFLQGGAGAGRVFVYACGESFYAQCAPAASVDLGYSATAMHWLTRAPAHMPDALHHTLTADEGVAAQYRAQAAADWDAIMGQRGLELKPGGTLVVANFAVDARGRILGTSEHARCSMFETFSQIWAQMAAEGTISRAEFAATNFPIFYRTLEECRAPFADAGSAPSRAGLRWVGGETDLVRCPYHAGWQAKGGDAAAHARAYVPTTRTWSNSTFLSGLDATRRGAAERDALVDALFERYTELVAAEPDGHAMDYVHSYIHLAKD